jgi:hypothetical protein
MFAIPVIGRHIKFLVLVRLAILLLVLLLLPKLLALKILVCQLKHQLKSKNWVNLQMISRPVLPRKLLLKNKQKNW